MLSHPIVLQVIFTLVKIVCLLVAIAYYTIAERKIMAAIQRRRGPNVVGFWGLLQPLADGLKLIAKEMIIPTHANARLFLLAPLTILTLSLVAWTIIPFDSSDRTMGAASETKSSLFNFYSDIFAAKTPGRIGNLIDFSLIADMRYSILLILALSSLSVYGIILAGWASNSKYAFLGALRSAAQMISYEVSISLILLPVILLSGSLSLVGITFMQAKGVMFIKPLLPLALVFFISSIAETNRTPFDLPEAEAELVAGYNVEYSSIIFAMFFLAEYGNMIMISMLNAILFLGGWNSDYTFLPPALVLALRGLIFCFLFVLVRATLPRYRYDQLMDIGWKVFLPLTTGFFLLVAGILVSYDALPVVFELFLGNSPYSF